MAHQFVLTDFDTAQTIDVGAPDGCVALVDEQREMVLNSCHAVKEEIVGADVLHLHQHVSEATSGGAMFEFIPL